MPLEGASKAVPAACEGPPNGVDGTCSPTALGRDPTSAACPIVSSSASPSKAGTLETGAGKTLGTCGAWSGVGGTFLTASASSSLRGAEIKGSGVGGAILLARINWEPYENLPRTSLHLTHHFTIPHIWKPPDATCHKQLIVARNCNDIDIIVDGFPKPNALRPLWGSFGWLP